MLRVMKYGVLALHLISNKALENARKEKVVGKALEAEVTLYVSGELVNALSLLGEELRFVLITSGAHVVSAEQLPEDAIKTEPAGRRASLWQRHGLRR